MAKKSISFLSNLIGNDAIATIAEDGLNAAEYTGCIDTGSYALNALLSGSMYGGVPNNKVTAFAGESSTGKTFFILGVIKKFLDSNPEAVVIYYDTESAVTRKMMQDRGIDTKRVVIAEPDTIQTFRTHAIGIIDKYVETGIDDRPPMMFVLDSLGMLSSSKELEDSTAGKDTRDMTKTQLIRATFRVLTQKLGKAKIPLLVTQHVYQVIGAYVPMNQISGGGGLIYAASSIVVLSKKKDKDTDGDVTGNIIRCKMHKSRLSRENKEVHVLLTYDRGLDPYYGLLEIAEGHGLAVKVGKKWQLPGNDKPVFESKIKKNPTAYFNEELMAALEIAVQKEFTYGHNGAGNDDVETEDEETEEA